MRIPSPRSWSRLAGAAALVVGPAIWALSPPPTPAADPAAAPSGGYLRTAASLRRTTLRLRDLALADALRLVAASAHANVAVQADVRGRVDFDFYDQPLTRIFDSLVTAHNLQVRQVGDTVVVSRSPSAGVGGLRVYQLSHANAQALVRTLASSLRAAGISKPEAQLVADARANAVVASGNERFQGQVAQLIAQLDQPQEHRVFTLNDIKAAEAAQLLRSSLFASASAGSAKFIPIVRDNALMVVASPEELRLAEEVLRQVDRKLRQVLVELKLVELNGTSSSLLGVSFSGQTGTLSGVFAPGAATGGSGSAGFDASSQQALNQVRLRLNGLLREGKARLLASPSIVAMDSKESRLEITDDIIQRVAVETTVNANQVFSRQNVQLGTAGITLAITPKVSPDGAIALKVAPEISFVRDTVKNGADIVATLKSTRKLVTPEVRVRDGETLIIGGLNQEREVDVTEKLPGIGNLPWIGDALVHSEKTKVTTELVVLLTPHLVPEPRIGR